MAVGMMKAAKAIGKAAFAGLFILSGIGHFAATDFYVRIMPPYLPYHRAQCC